MSFSSNVKAELCRPPISRRTEALAEAYGVLLYCNQFTARQVRITTESAARASAAPVQKSVRCRLRRNAESR